MRKAKDPIPPEPQGPAEERAAQALECIQRDVRSLAKTSKESLDKQEVIRREVKSLGCLIIILPFIWAFLGAVGVAALAGGGCAAAFSDFFQSTGGN